MTGIVLLIGFYLLGEFVAQIGDLPVPGSVIGLLLLLCVLPISGRFRQPIREGAELLLRFLPLFLIPIAVGAQQYLFEFQSSSAMLFVVNVAALLVSAALTALGMNFLLRRSRDDQQVSIRQ